MLLKLLVAFYRWIWGLPQYVAGTNPYADSAYLTMAPVIDIAIIVLLLIWAFARRGGEKEGGKK